MLNSAQKHRVGLHSAVVAVVAWTIAVMMSSCIYDGLPPCSHLDEVEFEIVNDWSLAPEANPEGMAYLFFPIGSRDYWRFDFPGREGGKVALPPGDYVFVMYNDDTSSIDFVNEGNGEIYVTTPRDEIQLFSGEKPELCMPDDPIHLAPDMMWNYGYALVSITERGDIYYKRFIANAPLVEVRNRKLPTLPRRIIARYNVIVDNVTNLSGVSGMKGLLCDLSAGIYLNTFRHSDEQISLAFDFEKTDTAQTVTRFLTFGLPPESRPKHNILTLIFQLSDDRIIRREIDVSSQLLAAPDPLDVTIRIDSLELPYAPPVIEGGGFRPIVTDWITIETNYEI